MESAAIREVLMLAPEELSLKTSLGTYSKVEEKDRQAVPREQAP